jgi:hypothetical protein
LFCWEYKLYGDKFFVCCIKNILIHDWHLALNSSASAIKHLHLTLAAVSTRINPLGSQFDQGTIVMPGFECGGGSSPLFVAVSAWIWIAAHATATCCEHKPLLPFEPFEPFKPVKPR